MAYLATLEEKKAKLEQLQEVFDRAIAGEQEISIADPDGGSVTYRSPDLAALEKRIQALSTDIAVLEGRPAQLRGRIPIGIGG